MLLMPKYWRISGKFFLVKIVFKETVTVEFGAGVFGSTIKRCARKIGF